MHKTLVIFSFLLINQLGFCQKLVEKALTNTYTKHLQIDASKCFELSLDTRQSNVLKVEASMEGEDVKDLVINMEENGKNILVSTELLPNFKDPRYKFSALKVTSIALKVTLPEYMTASIYGTNTSVIAKGKYDDLFISLSDGNCSLIAVSKKVSVRTQKGKIALHNIKGKIKAISEYGKVYRNNVPKGHQQFDIQSIEGDIFINYP